ncbi:hypothetical protein [Rhizobium sp. 1399]|uniref:hypothetical protein n=1 Tax=Rhizobium sp. 1399 TaxID=2817758 RepID=UPI00285DB4EC|nr:hypothetical protein [Rhizobium sp. 1399]MDR6663995.1 hypothetical protein [Rhizobium sp. 1399]
MAEKSADIQTLAPRMHIIEDRVDWLIDNRGGGSDPSELLKKLYRQLVWGAQPGAIDSDVWNHDTAYTDPIGEKSMHMTLFGLGSTNAEACQWNGKGLYEWIFAAGETRWSVDGETNNFASDVFGARLGSGNTYLENLRSNNLSLAKAVFGDVSTIGPNRSDSVMGRIEQLETQLEDLASNFEGVVADLQNQIDAVNERIDHIIESS